MRYDNIPLNYFFFMSYLYLLRTYNFSYLVKIIKTKSDYFYGIVKVTTEQINKSTKKIPSSIL